MRSIRIRAWLSLVAITWGAAACGVSGQQSAGTASPPAPATPRSAPRAPSVVCLATVNGGVRVYRLHQPAPLAGAEPEWRLSVLEPGSKVPAADVSLPGAVPAVVAGNARLSYRRADGLVVHLDTAADGASLEVALPDPPAKPPEAPTPGAERIGTGGAVRLPPCRIDMP